MATPGYKSPFNHVAGAIIYTRLRMHRHITPLILLSFIILSTIACGFGSEQLVSATTVQKKPKIISISALTDDIKGWVQVPDVTTGHPPFMEWSTKRVGDENQYYGGALNIFKAQLDMNQVVQPGYGDDVALDLLFDTENLVVTGHLSGKIISVVTVRGLIVNGEKLFIEPGFAGAYNGTCVATFTAVVKGKLTHDYFDTYKVDGDFIVNVQCRATMYASPGPQYLGEKFSFTETKQYQKTIRIYGDVGYYSAKGVFCSLNIGILGFQDPEGFGFMIMGDWGDFCRVGQVTEWYEDTQIKLEGPKAITPQTNKASFKPTADTTLGAINKVEWQFSYKSKAGEWVDLEKVVGSNIKPFNVTDAGGEISLSSWHDLAVANGVTGTDNHTMQMRVGLQAFFGDQLVGISNNLNFEYTISTELTIKLTGPDEINSSPIFFLETCPETFLIEATGEGSPLYQWVDCTFSYRGTSGTWVEIDKTSCNRIIVDEYGVLIPMSGEGVNWSNWLKIAEEQGVMESGDRVLEMRAIAKALTEDEIVLATSNEFMYKVRYYQRFNLTIRKSINIYPMMENMTSISVDFGGTKLTEPIAFGFEQLPPYVSAILNPPEFGLDEINSIRKMSLSFFFNNTKIPSGTQLPIETNIKVTATSGKYRDSKDVVVKCLPFDWLVLYYVAADSNPDLQMSEEDNIAEVTDANAANKNPRVMTYILADFREPTKSIKNWGQPLPGDSAYVFKVNMGVTNIIKTKGPTQMSSGAVLAGFIKEYQALAPSRNTWLSVSDHGSGIGGIIWDHHQGSYFNINEFEKALVDSSVKFDVLSFDACLMAQAEVVFKMKDRADYITCSEISEPGDGLAYGQIMTNILQNPELAPEELAKIVVRTFNRWADKSGTQSAIATDKVPPLETALNKFGEAAIQAYTGNDAATITAIENAADTARYAAPKPYVDIKDFMQRLLANTNINSKVKEAAQQVVSAVDAAVIENDSKFFELKDDLSQVQVTPSGFNGLTTLLWKKGLTGDLLSQYWSYRSNSAMIITDKWLDFLDEYTKLKDASVSLFTIAHLGHELHLIVTDSYGRRVGFNETHYTRDRILTEIPDCLYIDYMNGTKSIVLPKSEAEYRVTVDGSDMVEATESYTIKATVVENGVVSTQTTQVTIKQGEIQYTPVKISGKTLEIGKTVVKGEAVTPATGQPTGGIPAYPELSILVGVLVVVILGALNGRGRLIMKRRAYARVGWLTTCKIFTIQLVCVWGHNLILTLYSKTARAAK